MHLLAANRHVIRPAAMFTAVCIAAAAAICSLRVDCCLTTCMLLHFAVAGLCDPAVWSDVENGILGAGINGLTSTTLKDFTKGCGIKNRGAGTC